MLDGCKSKENLRTRFPANRKSCTRNYDYEDDSDLEEDDDGDDSDDELAVAPRVATEKSENDSPELVAVNNSKEKSSEHSDIISVSDLDSLFSDTKEEMESAHVGKVVVIEDVAFVTWVCFLSFGGMH